MGLKQKRDHYLGSNGVGTGGEKFGDTSGVETSLSETERGTETGTTGTDDKGIVGVVDDGVLGGDRALEVEMRNHGTQAKETDPYDFAGKSKEGKATTSERENERVCLESL